MFNRNKYNLGKFNTISGSVASSTATMLMDMEVLVTSSTKFSLKPNSMDLGLEVLATATKKFDANILDIDFVSEVIANGSSS